MTKNVQQGGWTLLEIMIVVTIIGMLALVGVPAWTAARNAAAREVCHRNQSMIFEQMNIYCLERNMACDINTFPNLCAVRDALVPLSAPEGERYIKKRNVFSCPVNEDQTVQHDYRFVRDGNNIIDMECDITEEHNDS